MPVDFFLFLNFLSVYDENRRIFEYRMSNRNLAIVGIGKTRIEFFIQFPIISQINNLNL